MSQGKKGYNKFKIKISDFPNYKSYLIAIKKAHYENRKLLKKNPIEARKNITKIMPRGTNALGIKLEDFPNYREYYLAYTRKKKKEWINKNPEYNKKQKLKWQRDNPTNIYKAQVRWLNTPKGRAMNRANSANRHAIKLKAAPFWRTKDHKKNIEKIYEECPKGYDVDHIVPLQGKNVRGLHVWWNLRYMKKKENISKGNRLIDKLSKEGFKGTFKEYKETLKLIFINEKLKKL